MKIVMVYIKLKKKIKDTEWDKYSNFTLCLKKKKIYSIMRKLGKE